LSGARIRNRFGGRASGRCNATLRVLLDETGDRKDSIWAISIDMSGEYQRAIRDAAPDAQICFDPFPVCRLAARAIDQVRRDELERPRALAHSDRHVGEAHALVASEGVRGPDRRPCIIIELPP